MPRKKRLHSTAIGSRVSIFDAAKRNRTSPIEILSTDEESDVETPAPDAAIVATSNSVADTTSTYKKLTIDQVEKSKKLIQVDYDNTTNILIHFKKFIDADEVLKQYSVCTLCPFHKLVYYGENMSSKKLLRHLKKDHHAVYRTIMASRAAEELARSHYYTHEQACSQPSIASMFEKQSKAATEALHLRMLMQYVVNSHSAMCTVEDYYFRQLISVLAPSSTIVTCSVERATEWVSLTAAKVRLLLQSKLKGEALTLTVDHWSSCAGDNYSGYTCHFVDESMKLNSYCLGCTVSTEGTTADVMRSELEATLASFSLSLKENVVAIVTDTAANMNAFGLRLKFDGHHWHGCLAHLLQLSVNSAFDLDQNYKDLMIKCRSIATFFHKSNVATQKLFSFQSNNVHLKVLQDCKTRWWSTFTMVERLVRLQIPLQRMALSDDNQLKIIFTEFEWCQLKFITEVLEPFKEVQMLLEGERYVTSSLVVKSIIELQQTLSFNSKRDGAIGDFSAQLLADVQERLGNIYENFVGYYDRGARNRMVGIPTPLFHAFFLDPNTKSMVGLTDDDKMLVIKSLINSAQRTFAQSYEKKFITLPSARSMDDFCASIVNCISDTTRQEVSLVDMIKQEVKDFSCKPLILEEGVKLDPLKWWLDNKADFPILFRYVRRIFGIVATSAPCERLFSSCGQTISEKRNRLTPEQACDEILLAANRDIVDKLC